MANYGEELAYWYLRLNGFFPIGNFVAHKSIAVKYRGDVDLIGVRLPYVYEEVGGKPDDWDSNLLALFKPNLAIGVICEVKTAGFDKIFREEIVKYSVGRFGFSQDSEEIAKGVSKKALTIVSNTYQIAKILFSNQPGEERIEQSEEFFHISLAYIRKFIKARTARYPKEKYAARMFFDSVLVQELIDTETIAQRTHKVALKGK